MSLILLKRKKKKKQKKNPNWSIATSIMMFWFSKDQWCLNRGQKRPKAKYPTIVTKLTNTNQTQASQVAKSHFPSHTKKEKRKRKKEKSVKLSKNYSINIQLISFPQTYSTLLTLRKRRALLFLSLSQRREKGFV